MQLPNRHFLIRANYTCTYLQYNRASTVADPTHKLSFTYFFFLFLSLSIFITCRTFVTIGALIL